MLRDLANSINPRLVLPPKAAVTNLNTAQVGTIIDMQGYGSLCFVILTGTNTDADAVFTTLVEHGDDPALADASAPVAGELNGTVALASFLFSDDNKCFKIGYNGNKRYVRLTLTPSGNNAGDMFLAAVAIQGHARFQPTPNPPV